CPKLREAVARRRDSPSCRGRSTRSARLCRWRSSGRWRGGRRGRRAPGNRRRTRVSPAARQGDNDTSNHGDFTAHNHRRTSQVNFFGETPRHYGLTRRLVGGAHFAIRPLGPTAQPVSRDAKATLLYATESIIVQLSPLL